MGLCAHSVSNCIIVKISVRCMCWCLVFWERTSAWYLASEEANIGRKGYEPWGCSFTVSMSIFAGAIDMHHNRLAQSKPVRRPFSIRWQRRIQQPAAERGAAGNKTAVFPQVCFILVLIYSSTERLSHLMHCNGLHFNLNTSVLLFSCYNQVTRASTIRSFVLIIHTPNGMYSFQNREFFIWFYLI